MSFLITDAMLPATLNCQPMTDAEFTELCQEHPDLFFEMTAEGELIVMAPTGFQTGARNSEIARQLGNWSQGDKTGLAFDSSTGFVLPNGARRSPDAAWTRKARIPQLQGKDSFLPLCPDFVIELRSSTDKLKALQEKLEEYITNGVQLSWLIDPTTHSVTIDRPNAEPEMRTNIDSLQGEGLLATFTLNLKTIWNPLG